MKGFEDQLPLAPLVQVLQQRAGEQAGHGLGLGHFAKAPDRLTSTFSAIHEKEEGDG